jgi:hypothetical protein
VEETPTPSHEPWCSEQEEVVALPFYTCKRLNVAAIGTAMHSLGFWRRSAVGSPLRVKVALHKPAHSVCVPVRLCELLREISEPRTHPALPMVAARW